MFSMRSNVSFSVLNYVKFIIGTYSQADILSRMFSCLSKWLEFGISIIQVECLFDYLFQSLNNENLFDDASDCIIVLFTSPDALKYWIFFSAMNQWFSLLVFNRYPLIYSRLLPYVLQLETVLDAALISKDKVKNETKRSSWTISNFIGFKRKKPNAWRN